MECGSQTTGEATMYKDSWYSDLELNRVFAPADGYSDPEDEEDEDEEEEEEEEDEGEEDEDDEDEDEDEEEPLQTAPRV